MEVDDCENFAQHEGDDSNELPQDMSSDGVNASLDESSVKGPSSPHLGAGCHYKNYKMLKNLGACS